MRDIRSLHIRMPLLASTNYAYMLIVQSYGHPNLVGLQDFDIEQQMSLLDNEISLIIGKSPVYMRPPYFSFNDETLRVLGQLGYKVIIADIDTNDWQYQSGGVEAPLDAYYTGLNNGGSIVLMHDVHQNTVENILPLIIRATLQSGRRGQYSTIELNVLCLIIVLAVTVGECLGDPETNWYRTEGSQTAVWNSSDSQSAPVAQTPLPDWSPIGE